MIFIDIEDNPPNQDWLDRADILTKQLIAAPDAAARNAIIDANEHMWGELKQHLCNLSHRKCWYSESINDGAHCHVDHFRPKKEVLFETDNQDKGGYWWLAFDWLNYRYSGPAPNVRKRSYFHVDANKANTYIDSIDDEEIRLLDPIQIDDPEKLIYDNEGKIGSKNPNPNSNDFIKVEYTIRRLNLMLVGLVEGRRDKFRDAANIIIQLKKLLNDQSMSETPARKTKIREKMKVLRTMASRKSEYSAAVKYCLKSSGLEWAIEIAIAAA
jgi:uncharacterized protein (TIGR02646 family)